MSNEKRELLALATMVRAAVVESMVGAHEEAGMQGLCGEGRFDLAVDRARHLDVRHVVEQWLERRRGGQDTPPA
jgi:hypothetical protein